MSTRRRELVVAMVAVAGAAPGVGGAAPAAAQGPQAARTLVVLNKAEATASLIDVRAGLVYATLPTGTGPHEVAVSPDGRLAVVSNYGVGAAPGSTLSVLDLTTAQVRSTISLAEHRRPHGLAWLPDGKRVLVTAEADSSVLVVDVEREAVDTAIRTDQAISHMVVLAPDGSRAYVTNIGSGSVTMLDLGTSRVVRTVPVLPGAEGIDVTPDGREVWVTCREANRVMVLDGRSLDTLATIPSSELPIRVKITPDGRQALVTNARSSELRIFDVRSRTAVATIKMRVGRAQQLGRTDAQGYLEQTTPIGLAIAPDGRTAYVANSGADIVTVVDLAKHRIAAYVLAGHEPDGLALSAVLAH
jgi:YVTN family beta-propeller protein